MDRPQPQIIETTAGKIGEELVRLGVGPDQRVRVAIETDDWLSEARRYTRPRIVAEGWSDADIDRIIEEERKSVQQKNA